jgi:hypothetical protein
MMFGCSLATRAFGGVACAVQYPWWDSVVVGCVVFCACVSECIVSCVHVHVHDWRRWVI